MKHENRIFENQTVLLDGELFYKCIFRRCLMKFSATAPVGMVGCGFDSCEWAFDGPAFLTTNFMSQLYQQGDGGKALIENTFEAIRKGTLDPIASLSIECPVKKVLVPVGEMERQTFDRLDFGQQTLNECPACGQSHAWVKSDVKLGPRMRST